MLTLPTGRANAFRRQWPPEPRPHDFGRGRSATIVAVFRSLDRCDMRAIVSAALLHQRGWLRHQCAQPIANAPQRVPHVSCTALSGSQTMQAPFRLVGSCTQSSMVCSLSPLLCGALFTVEGTCMGASSITRQIGVVRESLQRACGVHISTTRRLCKAPQS